MIRVIVLQTCTFLDLSEGLYSSNIVLYKVKFLGITIYRRIFYYKADTKDTNTKIVGFNK